MSNGGPPGWTAIASRSSRGVGRRPPACRVSAAEVTATGVSPESGAAHLQRPAGDRLRDRERRPRQPGDQQRRDDDPAVAVAGHGPPGGDLSADVDPTSRTTAGQPRWRRARDGRGHAGGTTVTFTPVGSVTGAPDGDPPTSRRRHPYGHAGRRRRVSDLQRRRRRGSDGQRSRLPKRRWRSSRGTSRPPMVRRHRDQLGRHGARADAADARAGARSRSPRR